MNGKGESEMDASGRRRYSVLEYREFLNQFTQEYPNYRKNIYRPLFWEEDLFTMNVEDMKSFLIDKVCANSRSLKYMQDNRIILSKFFGWCESRDIIPFNVFESQEYALGIFQEYMIERMDTVPIYGEEVERVISGIHTDRELSEVLIRGFFEGIESIADFVRLRGHDVDFEEETLLYRGVRRKMSPEFLRAVRAYWEASGTEAQDGKARTHDYLLRALSRSGGEGKDEEQYRRNQAKNVRRCMSRISVKSACELTPERLYVSGFLEFVKKKCREEGRDHVFFVHIFRCGYETKYHKFIEIYAKEYGMPGKIYPEKLRLRCYPYVVKDKGY